MNQTPRSSPGDRPKPPKRLKTWPPKQIPDFGIWLWHLRSNYRDITQEDLARRARISSSLVRKIESNNHLPEHRIVDKIVQALGLDEPQARYLLELWNPAIELAPPVYLHSRLTAASGLELLDYHEQRGVRAMFHNYLWDILAANPSTLRLLPGLAESDHNFILWFFSPEGRRAVLDWKHEAPPVAAAALAMLARHRDSARAQQLFDQLRRIPDFNRLVAATTTVAYGWRPDELIHRLDPVTSEPISMSVQTSDHFGTTDVFLTCCFERQYSGPPVRR
ncbi:helix-turn-helix domain-containing protein [Nocardia sp. XZ_19_385]|uniref:MmyB family transcriptional regulator n=1 Tax=Nocardia sp. XZ_19_385 TaxID=2769488 RepID=UPI00188FEE62|nr:helix-turn-helix domain-containing protein [Nocardia sp. XZ_19_385]